MKKFSFYNVSTQCTKSGKLIFNNLPSKTLTIDDLKTCFADLKLKEKQEKLRKIENKEESRQFKTENFPYVTVAGEFKYRKIKDKPENLIQHSGYISVDLDGFKTTEQVEQSKNILKKDPYVVCVFTSPSGLGLKVFVSAEFSNPEKLTNQGYFNHYVAFCFDYFKDNYKLPVGNFDATCSDITRAAFVCYDDTAIIKQAERSFIFFDTKSPVEDFFLNYGLNVPFYNFVTGNKHHNIESNFASFLNNTQLDRKSTIETRWVQIQGRDTYQSWLKQKPELNSTQISQWIKTENICTITKLSEKIGSLRSTYSEQDNDDLNEVENRVTIDFSHIINPIIARTATESHYKTFIEGLALKGNHPLLRRALYYYMHSVKMPVISFAVKNWRADNRDHILIRGTPGTGKGHSKSAVKHIAKWYDKNLRLKTKSVDEIHSVSSKEQLIGKMIPNKKEPPIEKRGYFGKDCLITDECDKILNEEKDEYADIQRIKRTAMDTYRYNTISKDLVNDKPGQNLSYDSPTRMLDFMHPVKLKSIFFTSGSFRRYSSIISLDEHEEVDLDDIYEIADKDYSDTYYLNVSNYITEFNLTDDDLELVLTINKAYIYALSMHENASVKLLGSMLRYPSTSQFLKRVLISHSIAGLQKSDPVITTKACIEHIAFNLNAIQEGINNGQLEASTGVWLGLSDQHAMCLQYLFKNNYITQEKGIPIKDFKNIIMKIFGLQFRQAERPYNELKHGGYIQSKKGQGASSSVWLNVIPKEKQVKIKDYMQILETIFQKCNGKTGDLHNSIAHFLDENPHLENQKCEKCNKRPHLYINNTYRCVNPFCFLFFILYIIKGTPKSCISNISDISETPHDEKNHVSVMQNTLKPIAFLEYINENDGGKGVHQTEIADGLGLDEVQTSEHLSKLSLQGDIYSTGKGYWRKIQ